MVCCVQLYIDFFTNIVYTNAAALITAVLCMVAIYAVQRWVNPTFKRKLKMPLPIELIVVCKMGDFSVFDLNFCSASLAVC